jgi:hypothetical protein
VSARLFPGIDRCAFKASVGRLIEIDMSSGVANECSFSSTESQTKDCCIESENRKEREEERERKIQEEEERDPGRCRETAKNFFLDLPRAESCHTYVSEDLLSSVVSQLCALPCTYIRGVMDRARQPPSSRQTGGRCHFVCARPES